MGKKNAEAYGRSNSGEGAVLVLIKPTRIAQLLKHYNGKGKHKATSSANVWVDELVTSLTQI